MATKNNAVCHRFRLAGGPSGKAITAAVRASSSLRNKAAMISPITIANTIEPMIRATPKSKPSTRAVRKIAITLIAGPEYRNADAGPMPAPTR